MPKKVKPKYYTKLGTMPYGICTYPGEPVVSTKPITIVDEQKRKMLVTVDRILVEPNGQISRVFVSYV